MKEEQLITLIDKYLAGKCSREEAKQVEEWYDSLHNGKQGFYKGDSAGINASAKRSLASIRNKLGLKENIPSIIPLKRKTAAWQWAIAACVVMILAVSAVFLVKNINSEPTYSTVSTTTGQVRKVQLPDGSTVWLNAGTQIKYSSNYNVKQRDVWVNGEAFFDVVHDADKPFNVIAGNIKTHVLGTAFSVSAYANTLLKTVTVLRGKVQVTSGKKLLGYLLPDQEMEYTAGNGKIISVNADKIVSWRSGKLSFIDMPMQDIAVHLQKWYGVNFVFKNEQLKNTRFTASFNSTISLNELLAIMKEVSHVRYTVNDKTKTITYL